MYFEPDKNKASRNGGNADTSIKETTLLVLHLYIRSGLACHRSLYIDINGATQLISGSQKRPGFGRQQSFLLLFLDLIL
jgi:hypothetical protein